MKNTFKKGANLQLIIAIIAFLTMGFALWTQKQFELYPCTYCILARLVIGVIGIVSLINYICSLFVSKDSHKENSFSLMEKLTIFASSLPIVISILGIYFNYKHYLVVLANEYSCGRDDLQATLNDFVTAKIWPAMFEATGNCVDANYSLFGFIDYVYLPILFYILIILISSYSLYLMINSKLDKQMAKQKKQDLKDLEDMQKAVDKQENE